MQKTVEMEVGMNTIHHIAIICSDKEAALHFYHDLMILANLGQSSYNSRTTFLKYTDRGYYKDLVRMLQDCCPGVARIISLFFIL